MHLKVTDMYNNRNAVGEFVWMWYDTSNADKMDTLYTAEL